MSSSRSAGSVCCFWIRALSVCCDVHLPEYRCIASSTQYLNGWGVPHDRRDWCHTNFAVVHQCLAYLLTCWSCQKHIRWYALNDFDWSTDSGQACSMPVPPMESYILSPYIGDQNIQQTRLTRVHLYWLCRFSVGSVREVSGGFGEEWVQPQLQAAADRCSAGGCPAGAVAGAAVTQNPTAGWSKSGRIYNEIHNT